MDDWKESKWLLGHLLPSPILLVCSHLGLRPHLQYHFPPFPLLNFPYFASRSLPAPSSSDPIETCLFKLFKVNSSENLNKLQVSYVPRTKAKLQGIVKELSKWLRIPRDLLKNLTYLSKLSSLVSQIYIDYSTCLLVRTKPNPGWN